MITKSSPTYISLVGMDVCVRWMMTWCQDTFSVSHTITVNHSQLTQNRVIKIECVSHHSTQAPNLWFLYLIYDGLFHLVFRFRLLLLFLFLFRSIFLFQRCNLIHIHWGLNSTLQEIKTEYVNKPRKIIWTMKTNTHVAC